MFIKNIASKVKILFELILMLFSIITIIKFFIGIEIVRLKATTNKLYIKNKDDFLFT